MHLLGYGCRTDDAALQAELARVRRGRSGRIPAMLANLERAGMPVPRSVLDRHVGASPSVGRPHLADAMVELGYVADRREAFDHWLADDKPDLRPPLRHGTGSGPRPGPRRRWRGRARAPLGPDQPRSAAAGTVGRTRRVRPAGRRGGGPPGSRRCDPGGAAEPRPAAGPADHGLVRLPRQRASRITTWAATPPILRSSTRSGLGWPLVEACCSGCAEKVVVIQGLDGSRGRREPDFGRRSPESRPASRRTGSREVLAGRAAGVESHLGSDPIREKAVHP